MVLVGHLEDFFAYTSCELVARPRPTSFFCEKYHTPRETPCKHANTYTTLISTCIVHAGCRARRARFNTGLFEIPTATK